MMTRKDYVAVAKMLREQLDEAILDEAEEARSTTDRQIEIKLMAHKLADYMGKDNPNFDKKKFLYEVIYE